MSSSILKNLIQPKLAAPDAASSEEEADMLDTLAVVVEHTPVAIAMFDCQMRYILANKQWVQEFNLGSALPLVGKSQYEVFPRLHPGWKQLYERALMGYTMRSDHPVQTLAGQGGAVLFRCEARPWRKKRDASVGGIVVSCTKVPAGPELVEREKLRSGDGVAEPDATKEQAGAEDVAKGGGVDAAADALPTTALPSTGPDVSSAPLPCFEVDDEGVIQSANSCAAELALARGLQPGISLLWEVLGAEANAADMREALMEAMRRIRTEVEPRPQALTVKPAVPESGKRPSPCRWVVSPQGRQAGRWLVVGLPGGSPFEAVATVGLTALTGTGGGGTTVVTVKESGVVAQATPAVEEWNREREALRTQLADLRNALDRSRLELRTLREAEQALLRREKQLQSVVEAMPGGVLVLDEHGRVLQQNSALKRLLGRELEAGESIDSWLTKACPDEAHAVEVRRLWSEDVWRRQVTRTVSLMSADGLLKEVEMRPGSLAQGGLLVHFQDVTGHCRVEEQLCAIESKFRALFQENPLPVVMADKSGAIFDVNGAAEALFQKPKAELRRMPVDALLSASGATARKDALREMRTSGETRRRFTIDLAGEEAPRMHLTLGAVRAADGGAHSTIHFFETPLSWPSPGRTRADGSGSGADTVQGAGEAVGQGSPVGLFDEAEEEGDDEAVVWESGIEGGTEQVEWVTECCEVPLLATGANGCVHECSAEGASWLGRDVALVTGLPLHLLFQPEDPAGFYGQVLPKMLAVGEVEWSPSGAAREGLQPVRLRVRGSGAEVTLFEVREVRVQRVVARAAPPKTPMERKARRPDSEGERQGSAPWAAADLTREQALLTETHHRVQHHLRLLGSLINMQSTQVADPAAREALRSTQNRLRAAARLHRHLEQSARQRQSFAELVRGLASHLQDSLEVPPQRVVVNVEVPEEVVVPTEWLMPLTLVVNEMLSNALEHGFPDGRAGGVNVRLTREGRVSRLMVEDNGVGLSGEPMALAERGKGLKMIELFAEQMRGQLRLRGGPGEGTCIEVQFFIAFADN